MCAELELEPEEVTWDPCMPGEGFPWSRERRRKPVALRGCSLRRKLGALRAKPCHDPVMAAKTTEKNGDPFTTTVIVSKYRHEVDEAVERYLLAYGPGYVTEVKKRGENPDGTFFAKMTRLTEKSKEARV